MLISGPAGVGKEVAARLLHNWSPRAKGPFVVVSAARMTPERVEEELFGVEEGGELVRPGLLEQAHGGTLFLDEIADMPLSTQGKILRVLTDQSFTRVERAARGQGRYAGGLLDRARPARRDRRGRFREDLYLPAERRPGAPAGAGRPARGHSGDRRPFLGALRGRAAGADAGHLDRRARRAAGL